MFTCLQPVIKDDLDRKMASPSPQSSPMPPPQAPSPMGPPTPAPSQSPHSPYGQHNVNGPPAAGPHPNGPPHQMPPHLGAPGHPLPHGPPVGPNGPQHPGMGIPAQGPPHGYPQHPMHMQQGQVCTYTRGFIVRAFSLTSVFVRREWAARSIRDLKEDLRLTCKAGPRDTLRRILRECRTDT